MPPPNIAPALFDSMYINYGSLYLKKRLKIYTVMKTKENK